MTISDDKIGTSVQVRTAGDKVDRSWRNWLIGRPLPTADAPHQTIGKAVGLAVFASDALSSTAYATQEIMVILAAAGALLIFRTWAMLVFAPLSFGILLRARREENLLAQAFGQEWETYANRVPGWIPKIHRYYG